MAATVYISGSILTKYKDTDSNLSSATNKL